MKYKLYIVDNLRVINTATGNDKDKLKKLAEWYIQDLAKCGHDIGEVEYFIKEKTE